MDYVLYFIAGFMGGIIHEIVQDNRLVLPEVKNGAIVLGFLGSALIGGVVGVIADTNVINAMLAGYVGISVIGHMLPQDTVT